MFRANPVILGTSTSITAGNHALTWPAGLPSALFTTFGRLDVLFNVRTLTGVSSTSVISFTVEEEFPMGAIDGSTAGTTFVTTAKNVQSINAAGQYVLSNAAINTTTGTPYEKGVGSNALLGKGMSKRVLLSTIGDLTSLVVDVVLVFYSQN